MTKHFFGATFSPAVATYGLRTLADDHAGECPKAAEFIRRDFYVDDGITSVNTTEEAQQLIEDARALCATGNLRLHKFISNDSSVLSSILESERAIDLFADYLSPQRTLGLEWNLNKDFFRFSGSDVKAGPVTRHGILSVVGQLFDPIGLLVPFTHQGRNILQKVNKTSVD
ncbi:uncharacterized protein [Watersipora subatra]|uniref:uncharacterized protein n=1 Tax=Watersipora subatra TaxID=2589382 RepID=UPI00355B01B5